MILTCLCLGPAGCSLFNKRSGSKDSAGAAPEAARQQQQPAPPGDPLLGRGQLGGSAGLLAGQVVDSFTGRPTEAFIRYECLDDGKTDQAPIDVTVGPKGFFTIEGLKPGKHYKLTARTKQGNRTLAGVTYTT